MRARVSVVGGFNLWDGRRHRCDCAANAAWEIFLPAWPRGAHKFEIVARDGELLPLKADPYARQSELRPATASVVAAMPAVVPRSGRRAASGQRAGRAGQHLRGAPGLVAAPRAGNRWLGDELAATLVPYAREMGFTHLELLPVSEHPFDGSWGYQPIGLFAPTSRFGDAAGFGASSTPPCRRHRRDPGLGAGALPHRRHGRRSFDGTALYEHADPREGFHRTGTR